MEWTRLPPAEFRKELAARGFAEQDECDHPRWRNFGHSSGVGMSTYSAYCLKCGVMRHETLHRAPGEWTEEFMGFIGYDVLQSKRWFVPG